MKVGNKTRYIFEKKTVNYPRPKLQEFSNQKILVMKAAKIELMKTNLICCLLKSVRNSLTLHEDFFFSCD